MLAAIRYLNFTGTYPFDDSVSNFALEGSTRFIAGLRWSNSVAFELRKFVNVIIGKMARNFPRNMALSKGVAALQQNYHFI